MEASCCSSSMKSMRTGCSLCCSAVVGAVVSGACCAAGLASNLSCLPSLSPALVVSSSSSSGMMLGSLCCAANAQNKSLPGADHISATFDDLWRDSVLFHCPPPHTKITLSMRVRHVVWGSLVTWATCCGHNRRNGRSFWNRVPGINRVCLLP